VGADLDLDTARKGAELCAANLLRIVVAELGSLERIERVLRLGVYVSCSQEFSSAHLVANGASDLLGEVLGEAGRHARSAICVPSLPLDAAVEVDAIFAINAAP
jgi:enamine deaminase RidA (YjgF/YER057c/UK114 family)